jgi:hypothetical protein
MEYLKTPNENEEITKTTRRITVSKLNDICRSKNSFMFAIFYHALYFPDVSGEVNF